MARAWLVLIAVLMLGAGGPVQTLVYQVDGMTCSLCEVAVRHALGKVDGVSGSEVDADAGRAVVHAGREIAPDTIEAAIESTGYEAELIEIR